jgi:large subunit ribosomal protein L18
MAKTVSIPFRRRREGKTNYKKRLAMLKSGKLRLVFRKSNRHCIVQIVNYKMPCDETPVHVTTKHLKRYGWLGKSNIPSAYLCGYLAAKKALKKGIKEAILDIGLLSPIKKSSAFAALKGALDAGLNIPHSKEALPDEDRILGKHIEEYAKSLSEDELNKRFCEYLKENIDPRKLSEYFSKAKEKIDQEYAG